MSLRDRRVDHAGHLIVVRTPDMANRPVVICVTCNVRLADEPSDFVGGQYAPRLARALADRAPVSDATEAGADEELVRCEKCGAEWAGSGELRECPECPYARTARSEDEEREGLPDEPNGGNE